MEWVWAPPSLQVAKLERLWLSAESCGLGVSRLCQDPAAQLTGTDAVKMVPSTLTVKPPGVVATGRSSALTLLAARPAKKMATLTPKVTRSMFIELHAFRFTA